MSFPFRETRSDFQNQIKETKDLYIGRHVKLMPDNTVVCITSMPYRRRPEENDIIDVKMVSEIYQRWYDWISLADFNIVPYKGGCWNKINYIARF